MSESGFDDAVIQTELETLRARAELLDLTHDSLVVRDLAGSISFWSKGAERAYGWSSEEVVGRRSHELLQTEFPEAIEDINAVLLRHGQWDGRLTHRTRDGRRVVVASRWSLRKRGPSGHDEVFEINIDVTAEDEAQRAAAAARDEAERANRAKTEFLSRMSHELRTPLNAILGFAQLLEMDELGPVQRDSVRHIASAGRHLLELIDEVLDISRVEAGTLKLSLEPVRVQDVAGEVLGMLAPLGTGRRVALPDHLETAEEVHVLADRQRLKQVLLNLVSNAVKYNREGGAVQVRCEAGPQGRVRIVVDDTGLGMTAHDLERLFVPFERLAAEGSTVEGTGLGLVLTKRLVEAMGGTVGVRSEPGRGSSFWVELTTADVPQERRLPPVAEATPAPGTGRGAPRTVLYVEDNLTNVRLVERVLARRPEVTLMVAMQGGMGLDLAREHRPSLVLLDLNLPDMPGEEALRRLRADPRTAAIPVVVVSADATPGQVARLRAMGVMAYLTKPFDVGRFLAVVDAIPDARAVPGTGDESSGDDERHPLDAATIAQLREMASGPDDEQNALGELVAVFSDTAGRQLAALRAAVGAGDAEAVGALAHSLAGASASLGAHVVSDLCRSVEARAGTGEVGADLPELVARLDVALPEAERLLRAELCAEAPAASSACGGGAGAEGVEVGGTEPGGADHGDGDPLRRVRAVLERPDALHVVFQPIVDAFDGRVLGAEALARFAGPPTFPPDVWFADAARVGLGLNLELLALRRAVEHLDEVPWGHLAVNLSPETLASPAFFDFVRGLGDDARRVVVELTEHAEVATYDEVLAALGRVRQAGVRLAVDDAGAGYSSFRHILRLAPDFIKLDRSIIADIDTDPARRALATAVADFGAEIGAVVVAEGVERLEELRSLRTTGVRLVQGYLTGRPSALPLEMPAFPLERAGGRALVVDDDPVVRLLVSRILRRNGLEVVGEAADGTEALALAHALKPEVVVLDLNMPVLDGTQALPGLRDAAPDARIIVLSVSSLEAQGAELRALGAHALVAKDAVASQLPEALSSP